MPGVARRLPGGDLRRRRVVLASERARGSPTATTEMIRWTAESFSAFGFDAVVEDRRAPERVPDGSPAGRAERAAAVLPPHRSGDHAQARHRGAGAQVARRSPGRVDRAAGQGDAALRHHHRDGRLHRRRRRAPQLLRPADARVPRLRRRQGLRRADRRQGQRAGGAAGGAEAPVVEGRARGARDEHGPVPVGGEALRADAGDPGGAAGCAQPVLGADEVAAAAARPGAVPGAGGGDGVQRVPVDPDAGRAGVAVDGAAHAAPAQAARGGREAQRRRACRPACWWRR